jgi:hypothetical protein
MPQIAEQTTKGTHRPGLDWMYIDDSVASFSLYLNVQRAKNTLLSIQLENKDHCVYI